MKLSSYSYSSHSSNSYYPPMSRDGTNYQSRDVGESTTHFVSFLKSLAMRVNAETLQLILSFPLNESGGYLESNGGGGGGGGAANSTAGALSDSDDATKSEVKSELMDALTTEAKAEVSADKLFAEPSKLKP